MNLKNYLSLRKFLRDFGSGPVTRASSSSSFFSTEYLLLLLHRASLFPPSVQATTTASLRSPRLRRLVAAAAPTAPSRSPSTRRRTGLPFGRPSTSDGRPPPLGLTAGFRDAPPSSNVILVALARPPRLGRPCKRFCEAKFCTRRILREQKPAQRSLFWLSASTPAPAHEHPRLPQPPVTPGVHPSGCTAFLPCRTAARNEFCASRKSALRPLPCPPCRAANRPSRWLPSGPSIPETSPRTPAASTPVRGRCKPPGGRPYLLQSCRTQEIQQTCRSRFVVKRPRTDLVSASSSSSVFPDHPPLLRASSRPFIHFPQPLDRPEFQPPPVFTESARRPSDGSSSVPVSSSLTPCDDEA